MNEVVLIIVSWLPVLVESGFFVFIVKYFGKQLKNHFSTPEKLIKELKDLKSSNAAINKQLALVIEENHKIQRENHKLIMKEKGFRDYDEEVSKN